MKRVVGPASRPASTARLNERVRVAIRATFHNRSLEKHGTLGYARPDAFSKTSRVCCIVFRGSVLGQTGTGNIQGTVKDASSAVVPGAKVTLAQTATNETTSTQTNGVGFFLFPALRAAS